MESNTDNPQPDTAEVTQHVAEAHRLLSRLRDKLNQTHPELEQAVEKLEQALSALTLKSGGML